MEERNKVLLTRFTKATEDHTVRKLGGSTGERDLRCADHRC